MYSEDEREVPSWILENEIASHSKSADDHVHDVVDEVVNDIRYDDAMYAIPCCVFDVEDAWFGRSFVGDRMYKKWYYDMMEETYLAFNSTTDENDIDSDEESWCDEHNG